jgi:hypothetical protein
MEKVYGFLVVDNGEGKEYHGACCFNTGSKKLTPLKLLKNPSGDDPDELNDASVVEQVGERVQDLLVKHEIYINEKIKRYGNAPL